jgi:alkylation response protein AidB-like acyl-CoA dehydrogenase
VNLQLSSEQQQLVEAFCALYAKESSSERVRAAEPLGFDKALWAALVDMGVVQMAVDEVSGGWGASLLDLTMVAEQHGRALGSAPVVETQCAARLLARCTDVGNERTAEALAKALTGEQLITFAPRVGRGNHLALVPAGTVADAVVAMVEGRLVLSAVTDDPVPVQNLGSMPLADLDVSDSALVLAVGEEASELFSGAVDEWLALTSAALVGIGARAVEIGASYAIQRRAFGVAIGSFQAVSHRLADSATAVEGARLLSYEAACAFADEPLRASELAALAFAFAYESARDATYRSLHFHGGYGVMMEQDIQLYYRRARGWANVFGGPEVALQRAADMRYGALAG